MLVKVAVEVEGLPEAVGATTAPVGTTQTQTLRAMHQQLPEVMVLGEVAVVVTEVVVAVATEVDVVADASMNVTTPAAEGETSDGLSCCDAAAHVT